LETKLANVTHQKAELEIKLANATPQKIKLETKLANMTLGRPSSKQKYQRDRQI
jgi:hypothetical protein